MPNVFARAASFIDRLIPASQSRRRELQLSRSRREPPPAAASASCIAEAEAIAAREWLDDASMSGPNATAPHEPLSDSRAH